MRKCRRAFLSMHNVQQIMRVVQIRWNSFGHNLSHIIKNEVELQEEINYGQYGLGSRALLDKA